MIYTIYKSTIYYVEVRFKVIRGHVSC